MYIDHTKGGSGTVSAIITSGNNSTGWEFPGGHAVTNVGNDSPRIDFSIGVVSKTAWNADLRNAFITDPFGLIREEIPTIGKALVASGLVIPVAAYSYRRRRAA